MQYEGYCVKCRKKVQIQNGQEVTWNTNGGSKRRAWKGKCPDCGTTVSRVLGKAA